MELLQDNCYTSCVILQLTYLAGLWRSRVAALAKQGIFNALWYNLREVPLSYFDTIIVLRQLIVSTELGRVLFLLMNRIWLRLPSNYY